MGRWSISFRSSDFNGDDRREKQGKRPRRPVNDLAPPLPGDEQHPCPRGPHCASSTRDEDGTWHPLLINSVFCLADESAIVNAVPGLPESYARLSRQMTDPLRSKGPGPGSRRPPGSRVLLDAGDDALLREAAMVLNGWAARVRAVPGIQLSGRRHLPHTQAGVEENCGVLARWTTQLLALPPGPTLRTWEYLPGRQPPPPPVPPLHSMAPGARRPARPPAPPAVPCRRCGAFVTPSPSGKHWWPAVCTHAVTVPARWAENADGTFTAVAWACAECSTPFRGSPPKPRAACAHEPSRAAPPPAARKDAGHRGPRTLDGIEEEIAGLEVVRAGDGWVTCMTELSGIDAGLDVLDLAGRFRARLQESPARPATLDGIPCRECEELTLVEADPPHDPKAEKDKSKCTNPACGARMTQAEYGEWTKMYDAWAKGAGPLVCKLCADGDHGTCWWPSCTCRKAGHPAEH